MIGMKNTMGLMLLMVVGLTQAAPQISTNQVVSTVTTQLQPLIAQAVADALAASSASRLTTIQPPPFKPVASPVYTEEPTAPAAYQYSYKVSDEEAQTYLNKDETRDGDNVQGTYSYVDSTGALVTVTYTAGPDGYNEERSVEKGFVTMRNIPGAWTGPLAGVDDVAVVPALVQPAPAPVVRRPAPQPAVDQAALIQLIISQLQPSISSAVQSAISSRQAVAPAAPSFSAENSVGISTPEFNTEY